MNAEDLGAIRLPFPELYGEGIRIAVVDTGVDPSHPGVGEVTIGARVSLSADGAILEDPSYHDEIGHGTACAAIIRRLAPRCTLLAAKIAQDDAPITPKALAAGIDWAGGADVISISAGTQGGEGAAILEECCRRATGAGVVVVATRADLIAQAEDLRFGCADSEPPLDPY